MAQKSKIQWTDATWNPWHGCVKVSPGCKVCYMYRSKERWKQDASIVTRSKTQFKDPLKWKEHRLVFTCSWSDFFIQDADDWRDEAWEVIRNTPQHTYQILTKRPERILDCLPSDWGNGYPNVWIGVSVENADMMWRVHELNKVHCAVRFVSAEPLIGDLFNPDPMKNISYVLMKKMVDWVIVGGESGNKTGKYIARPCKLKWIESIVDDCLAFDVPVFTKQLGSNLARLFALKDPMGGDISEWNIEALRDIAVRQYPKSFKR